MSAAVPAEATPSSKRRPTAAPTASAEDRERRRDLARLGVLERVQRATHGEPTPVLRLSVVPGLEAWVDGGRLSKLALARLVAAQVKATFEEPGEPRYLHNVIDEVDDRSNEQLLLDASDVGRLRAAYRRYDAAVPKGGERQALEKSASIGDAALTPNRKKIRDAIDHLERDILLLRAEERRWRHWLPVEKSARTKEQKRIRRVAFWVFPGPLLAPLVLRALGKVAQAQLEHFGDQIARMERRRDAELEAFIDADVVGLKVASELVSAFEAVALRIPANHTQPFRDRVEARLESALDEIASRALQRNAAEVERLTGAAEDEQLALVLDLPPARRRERIRDRMGDGSIDGKVAAEVLARLDERDGVPRAAARGAADPVGEEAAPPPPPFGGAKSAAAKGADAGPRSHHRGRRTSSARDDQYATPAAGASGRPRRPDTGRAQAGGARSPSQRQAIPVVDLGR